MTTLMRGNRWTLGAGGIAACVAMAAAPAAAQRGDAVTQSAGAGAFVQGIDVRIGERTSLPAAQRQSALTVASRVFDIMRRDPAIATPVGYTVRLHRAFGTWSDYGHFDSGMPFFAGAFATLFDAGVRPSRTASMGADVEVDVNTVMTCPISEFAHPLSSGAPWHVGRLPVLLGKRQTGEYRGHPIYDGTCVVISAKAEPPFIALTRGQYMEMEIRTMRDKVDSLRKSLGGQKLEPAMRDALDQITKQSDDAIHAREAVLAGMSAADRAGPAFVRTGNMEAELVSPDDDGGKPLVMPNPAFLDPSIPATKAQVVTVFLPFMQPAFDGGLPAERREQMTRLRDGLDWAALEELVRQ